MLAVVAAAVSALLSADAAIAQEPILARDTLPVLPHPAIVVRALPVQAALDDLPFAVSVRRTGLSLPTAGHGLAGELRAVPGLQVHSRYNEALGDRIVIRGFGARTQFGIRGVRVVVDGIPATMPDGQTSLNHLDPALVDRAEVLRGPAAATFGNAAGGAVLLTTAPPPPAFRQEVAVLAEQGGRLSFGDHLSDSIFDSNRHVTHGTNTRIASNPAVLVPISVVSPDCQCRKRPNVEYVTWSPDKGPRTRRPRTRVPRRGVPAQGSRDRCSAVHPGPSLAP